MTELLVEFLPGAVLSLALGALIGIEREFSKRQEIAGLRTFALVSFLGGMSAFISTEASQPLFFLISYAAVISYGAFTYANINKPRKASRKFGLTSLLALVFAFLAGGAVFYGFPGQAVIVTIAVTVVLFGRTKVHGFVSRLTFVEVADALELIIVLAIVQYFVPTQPLEFYGVSVPLSQFFFFVLAVSVISFIGFVLSRAFGERNSLLLFALASGLASGAAFALKLRSEVLKHSSLSKSVPAAVFASLVSVFARDLLFVLYFAPDLGVALAPTVFALSASSGLVAFYFHKKALREGPQGRLAKFESPFSVEYAAKVGALFLLAVVVAGAAEERFGGLGFVLSSFILSAFSSTAVAANTALLFSKGGIDFASAVVVFVFSLIISALTNILFLYSKPLKPLVLKMLLFGLLVSLSGVLSLALLFK
ncbi:MAG TPA: MgtC/SapB family protein [archaeon]|nr:MgtC/SapB family protein [archaeon]